MPCRGTYFKTDVCAFRVIDVMLLLFKTGYYTFKVFMLLTYLKTGFYMLLHL